MPFKQEERQYRDFSVSDFAAITRDEQEGEEPSYVVRGHFTVWDTPYELYEDFFEEIDSRALDECDMSDVIFQVDHEGTPLARTRNKTLRVGIDEVGGWVEADLGGSQRGRETYEAIQSGLIDRMSFGFIIADDGFEWEEDEDGVIHSRITKVRKLFDTSCVTWPANPSTDISARSYAQAAIDAKHEADRIAAEQAEQERAAQEAEEQRLAEEQAMQERIAAEMVARRKRRARAMQL